MPLIGTSDSTGAIKEFSGASAPVGYLLCQGQSFPITSYPALFEVIGYTYGGVVGVSYNLPDMRGKTPMCSGQDTYHGLTNRTIASFVGEENHTLITAELAPHTHSQGTMNTETQYHGHTATTSQVDLNHTHSYQASPGGGSDNGPSNGGTNSGYDGRSTGSANASLYHSHQSTMGNNIGDHTHTLTTGTGDGVSGTGHNNMQPYLVLNFIIKY